MKNHVVCRCLVCCLSSVLFVLLGGCAGPDFDTWEEAGLQLAREAGATVVRVDRLEDKPGTMFDDNTSHVELFATVDLDRSDAISELQSAGERLGYKVGDGLLSRDGSMILFWIPPESATPVTITMASVDCDCP